MRRCARIIFWIVFVVQAAALCDCQLQEVFANCFQTNELAFPAFCAKQVGSHGESFTARVSFPSPTLLCSGPVVGLDDHSEALPLAVEFGIPNFVLAFVPAPPYSQEFVPPHSYAPRTFPLLI